MKKYILPLFFIFCTSLATISYATELEDARGKIGSSMNNTVTYIKGLFKDANSEVHNSLNKSKDTKTKADALYKQSQEKETNPTVLDHAKSSIKACDYDSENLHWSGSKWDCVKAKAATDCVAAPDEYRYQDSKGDWVCSKHPKGGSINYYYQFRGYSNKCTGANTGYEKLYDCVYKNKLGQIIQVEDKMCAGKSKPSVANKLCPKTWTVGAWGSCSKTCGGGTQYRSVTCQSGYDCSCYPKPITSQSCNTQLCKADWVTGAWGKCSATACGTSGYQTRSVYCPTNKDCSHKPKPATRQNCSAAACPVCTWSVGNWSSCSVTACGSKGTQTRSVTKAGPSNCVGPYTTKPATSQACSTPACQYCTWSTGSWSACSATACGTSGTQTRSVWKSGPSGCIGPTAAKPAISQACSAPACVYTYSWYTSSWGSCNQACGGGTKSRTVYCKRSDGARVADSYCKTLKPYPTTSCNTQSCQPADKCAHLSCSGYYIFQCKPGDKDRCTYVSGANGCSCTYKNTGT